ncbi:MAG: TonB-dependent receptor, partial [Bacteroidota bacterium]
MSISFVGLSTFESELFDLPKGAKKDFGKISMEAMSAEIAEVEVVAVRPLLEVLPDKVVFNVAGSINATGNNGLELLRKSPGVLLDNNNNVMLAGQGGTRIFINGKPSPLRGDALVAWLESLQSNEVDAIEIINNPPAKYDAEGIGGIINIRLVKDKKLGTNANLTLGYSMGQLPRYNAGISGNFRNKLVNVFGNYNYSNNQSTGYFNMYREQPGGTFDQRTLSENFSVNHNAKIGT